MFIYSNGCSHTHNDFFNSYINTIHKHFFSKPQPTIMQVWEYLFGGTSEQIKSNIVKKLVTETDGILSSAYSGKSNQVICIESIEYINRCIEVGNKPDYVIIQWTGPSRRMIVKPIKDDDYLWYDCNVHDGKEYIDFEPLASLTSLMYIYQLQEFLKSNNIEYTFLCYHELDKSIEKLETFKKIDTTNFISYDGLHPILDGFRNKFLELNWVVDSFGHPNVDSNNYIAKKLITRLNKVNV